ncbi:MAG: putative sulfate exporter family transporter [Alphaproteobacteria bacterium]|nr:putative sulfate exporter family transporter [Alphaproteobacteria bacterium]
MTEPLANAAPLARIIDAIRLNAPGIALSAAVAVAAVLAAPYVAPVLPIPAMVIALFIGIALNALASRPLYRPGISFCVKTLLRWAVALLGLRIALGEIAALGLSTAVLVIVSMAVTLLSGFLLARAFGQSEHYGALAGAGTAVCGASATLATATVLPNYRGKEADVAFVVVAVNALSTLAMVLYPLFCLWLGFSQTSTGVMLGATIHDVAQVVGAGYAVSEPVGNNAVIVKLFRVFLLLPVVLAVGYWVASRGEREPGRAASVPVPVFALVFLALCVLNSVIPASGALAGIYAPIKSVLVEVSTWGLLIAIGALGLGTSVSSIAALGWRHVATVVGTTVVILAVVTAGLLAIG